MTSPCFMLGAPSEGRKSSAGSSELGDAPVQQMPHLDLTKASPSLSPRQSRGKRYHGGYLQHRVPKAAGLLKSWKRKFFRLREHGIVCYKTQEEATPLFEVQFTSHSLLTQDKETSTSNLSFILKHIGVMSHQMSVKTIEVPFFLKAEDEADFAAWTKSLRYMMEAHKRQANFENVDTDMTQRTSSDTSGQEVIKMDRRRRSSGSAVAPNLGPMLNSLVEVETFDAFSAKYLLMKEIGEGSFSIVHQAVNRRTGQLCAVKCCKICPALEEEERLLRTLSHPNVVSLEGVYEREKNFHYVVMDYLKNGDLCDLLIERQRLPEPEARRIIRQVVESLVYLHQRCVLHRDIKPENILIHGNIVKIADFGLAKELPEPTTMLKCSCGTMEYAAPELLCGRPYGLKSDVFSLGVVLYVVLFGAFPFSLESAAALQRMDHFPTGVDVRDMSCLNRSNGQWRMVSPLAQDVLLKMLTINDTERISAEDLLGHPWFDEIDDIIDGSTCGAGSTPEDFEVARVEDCEEMGFAELLSRGFQVVKYGNKESTTPHSTTIGINFMEECITWTGRKTPVLSRLSSYSNVTAESTMRARTIPLREINEIRGGHSTDAFMLALRKDSKSVPPPELCLSIVCQWRTLDLVFEAPTQREFMMRGLRRLLPSPPQ